MSKTINFLTAYYINNGLQNYSKTACNQNCAAHEDEDSFWNDKQTEFDVFKAFSGSWYLIHGQKCETVTLLFVYSKALFE